MLKAMMIAVAGLTAMVAPAASAQTSSFLLNYTTYDDGINPAIKVSATLTAMRDVYAANGYIVTAIAGTRGNQAITGISDPFSEFYYPATTLPGYGFTTYLDSFGITFAAFGVDYEIYRDPSDTTFYHEFENPEGVGVGRLILPSSFSITPAALVAAVPEPATWAMMFLGLGAVGFATRRRQKVTTRISYAA